MEKIVMTMLFEGLTWACDLEWSGIVARLRGYIGSQYASAGGWHGWASMRLMVDFPQHPRTHAPTQRHLALLVGRSVGQPHSPADNSAALHSRSSAVALLR